VKSEGQDTDGVAGPGRPALARAETGLNPIKFRSTQTSGRLKISPNSGLRDAASEDQCDHRQQRQSRSGGINSFLIMITPGFLAGAFRIGEENSIRALIPSGSTVAQVLIYFGALFLVALTVFAWAVFRTQHRQRHSHHNRPKPALKRHQQPEVPTRHRTLAEAGGLPPVRTEKQPPSPA
jgi:hypothetical protein